MQGDNVNFDINGTGLKRLEKILDLLEFRSFYGFYVNEANNRLVLFEYAPYDTPEFIKIQKFLTPLDSATTAGIVHTWLENDAVFDEEPDQDGDNEKGYRVHVDDMWGHVYLDLDKTGVQMHNAIAIEPDWIMYGK